MITVTLRDKLRKVLALAQSGQAGERDAAKNLLDKLLKENNLTIDDINSDEKDIRWFTIGKSPDAKKLMMQIYFMVTGENEISYWTSRRLPGEIAFMVTKTQAADMETYFSILMPALKKELTKARDIAFNAFCLKNNIVSGKSSGDDKELTPEEIRRLISISLYQNSMEPTPFRRQIQN